MVELGLFGAGRNFKGPLLGNGVAIISNDPAGKGPSRSGTHSSCYRFSCMRTTGWSRNREGGA